MEPEISPYTMDSMWHRIRNAPPVKKFVYTFLCLYIAGIIVLIVYVHRLLNPGPFVYAGIDPIAGAEEIYHGTRRRPPMGTEETWVLKIPKDYYEKLYKDCGSIGFYPGPYLNPAAGDSSAYTGIDEYIDNKAPSCYYAEGNHITITIAEFNGDKFIVQFYNSFPLF